MSRRFTSLLSAALLAALGAVLLVQYVQSARNRAVGAEAEVPVLVAAVPLPKGTAASPSTFKSELVPRRVLVPGAVSGLDQLTGLVAASDITTGEQLSRSMFQTPQAAGDSAIPKGQMLVTVSLEPQRVLGGQIHVGDNVGLFVSLSPPGSQGVTRLEADNVAVMGVQGGNAALPPVSAHAVAPTTATTAPAAPGGNVLVTLALDPTAAERVVWAQEFGKLWLSLEPHGSDTPPAPIMSTGSELS